MKPAWPDRRHRTLVLAGVLLAAALAQSIPARAQPSGSDRATAQALFDEARRRMKAGNFAEACPMLAESQRLDPATGTLFNLADCYEHVGRTASAWTMFIDVAARMKVDNRPEHEKKARQRAAALEPKLTRMTIQVGSPAAGLEILRDGVVVGSALWGTAMPVDPGSHTVSARAADRKPWETTLEVKGEGHTTEVPVPELEPLPPPPPEPPPTASASASQGPTAPPPLTATAAASSATVPPVVAPEGSGLGAQAVAGIVVMSASLLTLGLGGASGVLSMQKHDTAQATCFADLCDLPARGRGPGHRVRRPVDSAACRGGAPSPGRGPTFHRTSEISRSVERSPEAADGRVAFRKSRRQGAARLTGKF
ncbi:MAG: hypothetical protein R3B70_47240 [Polyangiaceae bacterium]